MKKYLAISLLSLGIFVTAFSFFTFNTDKAGASVVDSGTYRFKNITSTNASSTAGVSVKSKGGTLGSIVVASSSPAGVFRVYDGIATSTGTLVASFPVSAVAGTYTFDVSVDTGIVLDVPTTFNGNYTVTYR